MRKPIILWRMPTECSDESIERFIKRVSRIDGYEHLVVRDYDTKRVSYEVVSVEPKYIVTERPVTWCKL